MGEQSASRILGKANIREQETTEQTTLDQWTMEQWYIIERENIEFSYYYQEIHFTLKENWKTAQMEKDSLSAKELPYMCISSRFEDFHEELTTPPI